MADNSEDPTSAEKLKKSNLRGPYNQYLSQPGLKIPRTTLRRWPQNLPTSAALPSDDLTNTESIGKNYDKLPSGIFSIVTHDFIHMETDEPSHSLLSQTADPFETGDCESYCSQYEDSDHEQGDQCDPIGRPLKPSDSGLAEILAEDEQEGIKDYLTAFDSEQSVGNEKTDDQDRGSADVPLYSGAPITVAVSMLIITFAIRHSLTGLALVDLLTLVSLHCAVPNQCASSMDLVKKFFMKLKNPIQFHHYCSFCMEYQGLSLADDKLCKNRSCLKDLSKKEMSSYFIIIPLICQLRDLIQSK